MVDLFVFEMVEWNIQAGAFFLDSSNLIFHAVFSLISVIHTKNKVLEIAS